MASMRAAAVLRAVAAELASVVAVVSSARGAPVDGGGASAGAKELLAAAQRAQCWMQPLMPRL